MTLNLELSNRAAPTTWLLASCVSCLLMLSACSGAGIVATSDPNEKLAMATQLESSGRIARARQLTSEAADLFKAQGDQKGLAAAHRKMAFLIRIYGESAILGRADTTRTELDPASADKSNTYFVRARDIQEQLNDYGLVSHLEYNIGVNYALSDRTPQACAALDRSLAAYQTEKKRRPEHDPALPPGIASFDAFIAEAKLEAGCG